MIAYLRRVSEMTHAAALFCAEHRETLGNGPKFNALLDSLQSCNREIQQLSVASITSDSDRQASVRHRQTLAAEIRRDIVRFRAFAPIIEGVDFAHQCKCPASRSHEALRVRARAILEILRSLEPTLLAADLPIDAIPRFSANLRAFETATATEATSRHNRITANSQLEAKIKEARTLVRQLGAILQFRMRQAPDFLAAWQSVSHIERGPRRQDRIEEKASNRDSPTELQTTPPGPPDLPSTTEPFAPASSTLSRVMLSGPTNKIDSGDDAASHPRTMTGISRSGAQSTS